MSPFRKRLVAGGLIVSLGLAGAAAVADVWPFGNDSNSDGTEQPVGTDASPSGVVPEGAQAVTVTDAELQNGGYNCAPNQRPEQAPDRFDFGYEIDFFNQKPEQAHNLENFIVNDPTYGIGEEAWQVLLANAWDNGATSKDKKVEANADINTYAHKVIRTTLVEPTTFVNFTCTDGEGNSAPIHVAENKPLITLGGPNKNLVDGMLLDQAGYAQFKQTAKNQERFKVITGLGDKGDMVFIVFSANGCENQERLPVPKAPEVPGTTKPETPGTTQTTRPSSTTTTPPTSTPPSTSGKRIPPVTVTTPRTVPQPPPSSSPTTNPADAGDGAPPNGQTPSPTAAPGGTIPNNDKPGNGSVTP